MPEINENVTPTKQEKKFILFAVKDDARFLSHRETQTIWHRAFIRANIPVRFSNGFNPRIKMSLPLPRNVGVASECELLLFSMQEDISDQQLQMALNNQLPDGIDFIRSGTIPEKQKVIPYQVQYLLYLHKHVNIKKLEDNISQLNLTDEYFSHRCQRGRHKARTLNIKNNINEIMLRENAICLTISLQQDATARLDEIVTALGLSIVDDIQYINRIQTLYQDINNSLSQLQIANVS